MDSISEFKNTMPCKSEIALVWLGQAGFLVKDCKGTSKTNNIQDKERRIETGLANKEGKLKIGS